MRALDILNKVLFYSFFLLLVILLFFDARDIVLIEYALVSFILTWVISLIFKARKINKDLLILVSLSFWLNIIGEFAFYYSDAIPHYDKFLHLIIPIFITIMILNYFRANSIRIPKDMIFCIVLGMLTLWEIYEYFVVTFFGYPLMGYFVSGREILSPLDDTMLDLIFGAFGVIIYLIFKKEEPVNLRKKARNMIMGIKNRIV